MTVALPDLLGDDDRQNIGYTNRIFVQALFPYRRSDDYRRAITQGSKEVIITSPNGLPYGKYPRLIMAYIITAAVARAHQVDQGHFDNEEARRIPLGESMNEFFRRIGTGQRGTGGTRGTITLIREQLLRLASSTIVVQSRIQNGSKSLHQGLNQPIADEWQLWFDSGNPNQTTLEDSYIQLTKRFFDLIADAPIPIDLDILQKLGKPRAMDIYVWITLKKAALQYQNQPSVTFSWREMEHQFSTKELTTGVQRRDFREEFKKSIESIRVLWPNVGIEADTKNGVTIHKGAPSVSMKKPRSQLP
ncbi:replication protein RepA [Corynebacterium auriscanis]|uniref:replication protein RepA n=1 Tax=Corynebacterium auriscanis TaxID=99807 RepID=UPI003CEF2A3F